MDLSYKLIQDFVKATSDKKRKTDENNHAFGYVTFVDGEPHVQLDGSESPTPVATTSSLNEGDRVLVLIEKHAATVIGNVTAPSVTSVDIDDALTDVSTIRIKAENQAFTYDSDQAMYMPETITLTPEMYGLDVIDEIIWFWTTPDDNTWHVIDSHEYSTTDPYLNDDNTLVVPSNARAFAYSGNSMSFKITYTDPDGKLYSDYTSIFRVKDTEGLKGEDATVLRIDSSRGVIFKNNDFSTVLTVTIQKGSLTINDISAMRAEYGVGSYLQWYWRKYNDNDWQVIASSDSHITNNGFSLTVTPNDVDEKIVFKCDLVTD